MDMISSLFQAFSIVFEFFLVLVRLIYLIGRKIGRMSGEGFLWTKLRSNRVTRIGGSA